MSPESLELLSGRWTSATVWLGGVAAIFTVLAAGSSVFAVRYANLDANSKSDQLKKYMATSKENVESIKKQTIEAERKLEAERKERLELEKSLGPRRIPFMIADGESNIDSLKSFAGMRFTIRVIPDFEAQKAAEQIAQICLAADWDLVSVIEEVSDFPVSDGVTIQGPSGILEDVAKWHQTAEAANTLNEFLHEYNWHSTRRNRLSISKIPHDFVSIEVGYKPSPLDIKIYKDPWKLHELTPLPEKWKNKFRSLSRDESE